MTTLSTICACYERDETDETDETAKTDELPFVFMLHYRRIFKLSETKYIRESNLMKKYLTLIQTYRHLYDMIAFEQILEYRSYFCTNYYKYVEWMLLLTSKTAKENRHCYFTIVKLYPDDTIESFLNYRKKYHGTLFDFIKVEISLMKKQIKAMSEFIVVSS